jgi:hypothetical protein
LIQKQIEEPVILANSSESLFAAPLEIYIDHPLSQLIKIYGISIVTDSLTDSFYARLIQRGRAATAR